DDAADRSAGRRGARRPVAGARRRAGERGERRAGVRGRPGRATLEREARATAHRAAADRRPHDLRRLGTRRSGGVPVRRFTGLIGAAGLCASLARGAPAQELRPTGEEHAGNETPVLVRYGKWGAAAMFVAFTTAGVIEHNTAD